MNLLAPKINLHERKILCIDDLIAPSEQFRREFLFHTRLDQEDVLFTDSYSSALELIESRSDIGIAIVDIRIPKNPEDLHDYNPENPDKEWGIELIERLYQQKNIIVIVVSAYRKYDLSNNNPERLVKSFYSKPIDFDALSEDLELIIKNNWAKTFDYSVFDPQTSLLLRDRAEKIKYLTKKIGQDIFDIGRYLIEAKEKLEHGQFYSWLDVEFSLSYASATRFMQVAKKFKSYSLNDLPILPSALYQLATNNTPGTAVEEALQRARKGEVITEKLAIGIKDIHKRLHEQIDSKLSDPEVVKQIKRIKQTQSQENKGSKKTQLDTEKPSRKKIPKVPEKLEQPKQTILGIQSREKPVKNTWWQLGEEHQLFCGEPKSDDFLTKLPSEIALAIHFISNNDFSFVPLVKSKSTLTLSSESHLDLEAVVKTVRDWAQATAKRDDTVVFCYLFDLKLLELAVTNNYKCTIAEPNLEKCDRILQHWREKDSVKKIIS